MKTEGCPHLGLRGDPHTFTAFPSTANFCHRVSPPSAVAQTHQQACCLTAEHVNCPVFLAQSIKVLPLELRGPDWQKQRHRGLGRVLLALVLSVAAVALFFFAWQNRDQLAALLVPAEAQADEPVAAMLTPTRSQATSTPLFGDILPVATVAATPTPSATPTATPTSSPSPTNTATPSRTPTVTHTPTVAASATVPVMNTVTALIIVERANIRSGPGPDYGVVGVVTRDQQLAITGRTSASDWWQVCCVGNSQPGWLFGELATTLGDVSSIPAVPAPPLELTETPVAP